MKTTIRLGDLIAALYDQAEKKTKDNRKQSVLVGLALRDLRLRYGMRRKRTVKNGLLQHRRKK